MLYISTRDNLETYTAYRALHEVHTPDGGYFVPFYLPTFSSEALNYFKRKSSYETIAEILNLFFSLRISASDVENAVGKPSFACENIYQNLSVAELYHTPEGDLEFTYKKLNQLLSGYLRSPEGWTRIAIEIALLFGILSIVSEKTTSTFDMSVTVNDFSSVTAVLFAKAMGFPAKLIICACDDNSILWDLTNKGECSTSKSVAFFELFLYKIAGSQSVTEYIKAAEGKKAYNIDENIQHIFIENIYPAVVSASRADSIISGMYRSNQYMFDNNAALAYGGLQDYRAIVGINNQTLIFVKKRPDRIKE